MDTALTVQAIQSNEKTEWQALSEAILNIGPISSLDVLLHQALDTWLHQLSPTLRWRIATSLYTKEEVSLGRAAEISGLNYIIFMEKLRDADIPFVAAESTTDEQRNQRKALIHAGFNFA